MRAFRTAVMMVAPLPALAAANAEIGNIRFDMKVFAVNQIRGFIPPKR